MRRCMKKPRSLKMRCYAARLIYLNEYLASFPGTNISNKIGITELNEIILDSMPSSCSNKAYVQVFEYESILFKIYKNIWLYGNCRKYLWRCGNTSL